MFVVVILACSVLAVVLTLVLIREARRPRQALEALLRRLFSYGRFREKHTSVRADDAGRRPGDRLPE